MMPVVERQAADELPGIWFGNSVEDKRGNLAHPVVEDDIGVFRAGVLLPNGTPVYTEASPDLNEAKDLARETAQLWASGEIEVPFGHVTAFNPDHASIQELREKAAEAGERIKFIQHQLAKNVAGEKTYTQDSKEPDSIFGLMLGIQDWEAERQSLLRLAQQRTVEAQLDAMGASVFQVGVLNTFTNAEGEKEKIMRLRDWDKESLVKAIPWLKLENARGADINIRPMGDHTLSMVDDVKASSIQEMKDKGFAPAVVIETSKDNFQVWVDHGQVLTQEERTAAAKKMAIMFDGDPSGAAHNHMGRLAGFTNQKPDRRDENGKAPWVKLHEADGLPYERAQDFVREISEQLKIDRTAEQQRAEYYRQLDFTTRRTESQVELKTIDDFRQDSRYAGDGNRSDIAYAVYALNRGVHPKEVEAQIRTRDLCKKGGDKEQTAYIKRTLEKAGKEKGLGVGR